MSLEVLEMRALTDLIGDEGRRELRARVNCGSDLSPEELTHILRLCDCFWQHAGEGTAPHAELTSGKHSDGFVNVLVALKYTVVMELFALTLARRLEESWAELDSRPSYGWCIGSDHAAAVLAQRVAWFLDIPCADFAEKRPDEVDPKTGKKIKVQAWERHPVYAGHVVLRVEELITTAATTRAVNKAIVKGNREKFNVGEPPQFAPMMGTIVNRSEGIDEIDGTKIVPAVRYNMHEWEPQTCPLCIAGSRAVKPKVGDNWALLKSTGKQ